MEIWKDINGYETRYQVSNFGRVRSLPNNIILNTSRKDLSKYQMASLYKGDGSKIKKTVHRIVAEAFILNPQNKKQVNHKDGNKHNNYHLNLEWVTHQENAVHAWKTGLCENSRKATNLLRGPLCVGSKKVLDLSNGIFYDTIKDAALAKGIRYKNLSRYLNSTRPNKSTFIYA